MVSFSAPNIRTITTSFFGADDARVYCHRRLRASTALLIEREPSNLQAQSLQELIEKGVARDGYIGMALMGGAAAVGGVLLAGLLRRRR